MLKRMNVHSVSFWSPGRNLLEDIALRVDALWYEKGSDSPPAAV